jgi:glycosyltransferase involved in cell wall biosynthesis
MKISGLIITLNEEKNIEKCIRSMLLVCDDIVVVDSLSNDKTKEISENLGALVVSQKYLGDGPQRSYGLSYCKHKWVLNLDADERVDLDLAETIKSINLDDIKFNSYEFRRKNIFHNKWIKTSGWYPDYIRRLFDKTQVDFSPLWTHTRIQSNKVKKIKNGHVVHYTSENYQEIISITNQYSSRRAEEWYTNGKKVLIIEPFLHGITAFLKAYLIKRGFMGGIDGFNISLFKGLGSYLKYMKLYELQKFGNNK